MMMLWTTRGSLAFSLLCSPLLLVVAAGQRPPAEQLCSESNSALEGCSLDSVLLQDKEAEAMETSLLQLNAKSRGAASELAVTNTEKDDPMYHSDLYNTPIPKKIMTPAQVTTPIGIFNFSDGIPDDASVDLAYRALDFTRGIDTFLNWIPAASMHSLYLGWKDSGGKDEKDWVIFSDLVDSNSLFLTGNMDTVYAYTFADLEDGPVVVDVPPGMGPSTVDDAFFRFVVDMGIPGNDRGLGGKYLLIGPPETYKSTPAVERMLRQSGALGAQNGDNVTIAREQYFVAHSSCYINFVIARGLLAPDPESGGEYTGGPADKAFRAGVKAYKLAETLKPSGTSMRWKNQTNSYFNTIHANNIEFYEEVHEIIQREPASCFNRELLGQASAIGIRKGKPFAPDEKRKKMLTDAVAAGNAIARALSFEPRDPECYLYGKGKSQWLTTFIGGNHEWLIDGGSGGVNMDARTYFFYLATVNTPAMVEQYVGAGSQYAYAAKDSDGDFFDGNLTYKVVLPPNVPAKDFWSFVVYDPQTRSMLQTIDPTKVDTTGELGPGLNSLRSKPVANDDSSYTVYFGPHVPPGVKISNWIKTVPGKRWFTLLRLYGPLQPYYDGLAGKAGGWRPSEITKSSRDFSA